MQTDPVQEIESMATQKWLRSWGAAAKRRRIPKPRRNPGPRLEVLEDLTLPSTMMVMNLDDGGDGSLRQAIQQANANPGGDEIAFAPGMTGTITLTGGELQVTDSLSIRGPGAGFLTISGNDA